MAEFEPCTLCQHPSWIGVNPHCTNKACQWFDRDTWIDWIMQDADPGDPPPEEGRFRDFCAGCHVVIDFHRHMDQLGDYHAFCTQCGVANYWASEGLETDKTDPLQWQLNFPGWKGKP